MLTAFYAWVTGRPASTASTAPNIPESHTTASVTENTGVEKLKSDFNGISQDIIQRYYHQPVSHNDFHTQGSDIAREIHGGMHASRVSIYVEIIYYHLKEMLPEFFNKAEQQLMDDFKLPIDSILILARFAGLCHDAAREGEGQDIWGAESGDICTKELKNLGISDKFSNLFGKIIALKDHPKVFEAFLNSENISTTKTDAYHLLRILVQLSDCLDIIRCISPFNMRYPSDMLKSLPGYDQEKHGSRVDSLVEAIYQLIDSQHDMRWPCTVLNLKQAPVKLQCQNKYDVKHKKIYEHGEAIMATMEQAILQIDYFSKFMPNIQGKYPTQTDDHAIEAKGAKNLRALASESESNSEDEAQKSTRKKIKL